MTTSGSGMASRRRAGAPDGAAPAAPAGVALTGRGIRGRARSPGAVQHGRH